MRKYLPPRILYPSIYQLFRHGLDILLPNGCALCGAHVVDRGLCTDCWLGLNHISAPFCARCRRPLAHALLESLCGSCHVTESVLKQVRSVLIYDVVTTGATMESCASLLMSHGKAASVSALILLRVM